MSLLNYKNLLIILRLFVVLFTISIQAESILLPKNSETQKESFIISQEKNFGKDTEALLRYLEPLLKSKNESYITIYTALLANGYSNHYDAITPVSTNLYKKSILQAHIINNIQLQTWAKLNYVKHLYKYKKFKNMQVLLLEILKDTKNKNPSEIILPRDTYQTIGWIMQTLNDYKEAEEYFNLALKSSQPNSSEYAAILDNLGYNYYKLNAYDKALNFFSKAGEMALKSGDTIRFAKALGNKALVYENLKQYDAAIQLLLQDIDLSKKLQDDKNVMFASKSIARIYLKNDEWQLAEEFLKKADDIAKTKSYYNKAALEITQLKLQFLKSKPNSTEELATQNRMLALEDSLENADSETNINLINWQLQKEKFNTNRQESQVLQKKNTINRNILIAFIYILSATILGFLIYRKFFR